MKTRSRQVISVILIVFSSALLVLPVAFGADAQKAGDGKAVFESKCLKCHKVEKFKKIRNDRKEWDMVLRRMERNSCILSEPEAKAVADYLTKEYGE